MFGFGRKEPAIVSRSKVLMIEDAAAGEPRYRERHVFLKHGVWWLVPEGVDREHNKLVALNTQRMARSPVELVKALESLTAGQLMPVQWAPLDDEVAAWVHMVDELGNTNDHRPDSNAAEPAQR